MAPKLSHKAPKATSKNAPAPTTEVIGSATDASSAPSSTSNEKVWDSIDRQELVRTLYLIVGLGSSSESGLAPGTGDAAIMNGLNATLGTITQGALYLEKQEGDDAATSTFMIESIFGVSFLREDLPPAPDSLIAQLLPDLFRRFFYYVRKIMCRASASPFEGRNDKDALLGISICIMFQVCASIRRRLASDKEFHAAIIRLTVALLHKWEEVKKGSWPTTLVIAVLATSVREDGRGLRTLPGVSDDLVLLFKYLAQYRSQNNVRAEEAKQGFIQLAYCLIESDESWSADWVSQVKKFRRQERKENLINPGKHFEPDCCDACGKQESSELKLKKCGRCHVARYCSSKCQTKDWTSGPHKGRCRPSS